MSRRDFTARFVSSLLPLLLLSPGLLPVSFAQDVEVPEFAPRVDYGARLEPRGVIMHGAGQDADAFDRYSGVMPDAGQPLVYMAYAKLKDLGPNWAVNLRRRILRDPGTFLTVQLGLSMTEDGKPGESYEGAVAAGDYDSQISHLIAGLKSLTVPVYLRIGYEFNGLSWNGYRPEPYKEAFRRIVNQIRAAQPELEVATVWCAAIDGTRNFEDFYPGDDYVDWYGIDIFSASHFSPDHPGVAEFLQSASARHKPVMLGETTPRGEGAQQPGAWDAWFQPFFRWMAATPQLKQFNYINWDWAALSKILNQPGWANWGDARLETEAAEPVRGRFNQLLSTPGVFLHNDRANSGVLGESLFRQSLLHHGEEADTAVPLPSALAVREGVVGGLGLEWQQDTLEGAFIPARFYIYRNGELVDFSIDPQAVDERARAGDAATYQVAVMTRGGKLSELSEPLEVSIPAIIRADDTFTAGATSLGAWQLDLFHADARATATPETEGAGVRIGVERVSATNWHIQFRRFVQLNAERPYRISIRLRADRTLSIPLWLQQDGAPNTIYLNRSVALGTEARTFDFDLAQAPATTRAALSLILGGAPAGATVWVESVQVTELPPPAANSQE